MSGRQLATYGALTLLWVIVVGRFWGWWMRPDQRGALGLFLATSLSLAYLTTLLPSFYWFFVGRMRRPAHLRPAPGTRVALITLCVPSHETLAVIARQLEALTAVRDAHDSWVLDEGADPDVEALAHEFGVRYFTRKDVAAWNQPGPPFQARTKAGNVNAWLDHIAVAGHRIRRLRPARHRPSSDAPPTSSARWATSATPMWPGSRHRASRPTSRTGRPADSPSRTSSSRARCRWASTATPRTPFIIGSHTTLPHRRGARHRRLPADARRGPSGHGRPRGVRLPRRVCAGDHRDRRRARRLRDLPRAAVRLGVLDGADLPAPHAAPGAPLHARAGIPVPDGAELVHAVVAVTGGPVAPADRRAARRSPDRPRRPAGVPRLPAARRADVDASCGGGRGGGSSPRASP